MFNSFKNIVNSSLQELDRLGESSFGVPQQQQQQGQEGSYRGHNTQNSVDGAFPFSRGHGEHSGNQLQAAGYPGGSRRSPNMHARHNTTSNDRSSPLPFFAAPTGHAMPVRVSSPNASTSSAMSHSARPVSSSGTTIESSSRQQERQESSESFSDFGFSSLKRSLSINKASLDLSGIRSSFDMARPNTSGGSPSTPSRELNASGQPVRPSLSTSGPRRRKSSARSFSVSGITGPYTPDTMMRQDPFFFTALQALPDDLKIAAFTPLPTEDDDEYLEGIDNEINRQASTFPSALPSISTSGLRKHGSASFSGPSSAPAAGFMRSSFGSPAAARSPLLESSQTILGRLEDHVEEEEKSSAHPSPFASTTPLQEGGSAVTQSVVNGPKEGSVTASRETETEENQQSSAEAQEKSALGLYVPSPTFSRPASTDSGAKEILVSKDANTDHPLAVPPATENTSRPVSPALPPKHESLQARLARLAKSRGSASAAESHSSSQPSAPTVVTSILTSSKPTSSVASPQADTPQSDSLASSMFKSPPPPTSTRGDAQPREATSISSDLGTILKRYLQISDVSDMVAVEQALRQQATASAQSAKAGGEKVYARM